MGRRWLWAIPAAGLALVGVAAGTVRALWHFPADVERAPVASADSAPLLPRGEPLKVLVWNIQFSASHDYIFFYDGGETVSVPSDKVTTTLDEIAAFIRAQDPDIVVLQEVDRSSRRTGYIDQHALLREKLDMPSHTAAPYHKAAYVPHPPHEHMGKVDMNLSVFSKYRIDSATRHQLPLLQEGFVRRMFNLRRAVLEVRLPVDGGGELVVMDTHLSAFSMNDGTLERQVAQLGELSASVDGEGVAWFLTGDFNALPPGDEPSRIDAAEFYSPSSGVQPLFDAWTTPFAADEPMHRTYVPHGATEPDRVIDYLFHGERAEVTDLVVHRDAHRLSDHLPFTVTVTVR